MWHKFNFCFTLAVVIILLSAINCNNAPTMAGKMIRINYPRGGETFSAGDRVIIQWIAAGGVKEVDIFLFASFDNYGELLAQNIPAEIGQFAWTIQTCPAYNQYFRIEITDSASLAAMTTSLGFTIRKCPQKKPVDFLTSHANIMPAHLNNSEQSAADKQPKKGEPS